MKYILELDEAQLQILDKALQEIPFKFASPLINEINKQITAQIDAAKEETNV